jgi:hypothetical protein
MLDITAALERMRIPLNSPTAAIRTVAEKFEGENVDAISLATKMVKDMIGVDMTFSEANEARLTAMALAEAASKTGGKFEDEAAALGLASVRAREHMVKNAWMYVKKSTAAPSEVKAVVEGIDTKVAVKKDGSIKKGGKQILAAELYKKHVLEATTAATNQEFIKILVKELGMSKAGATTYAYNCKKQLGEPKGGIVKAKKGRKAKVK